jgi:hypothetical protein
MKTVRELVPLAIGVAVIGGITWFALTRGWAVGPWLLAVLLIAHGLLHVLFVVPRPATGVVAIAATSAPDLETSWLIGGLGIDAGRVRATTTVLVAIVCARFALAALCTLGLIVPAGWWAGLVAGSAVGSIVILTLVLSPSLLLGYAIDLALLWLVAASGWSPAMQVVL